MGFRITEEDEVTGIDITTHAETGYDLGTVHASGVSSAQRPGRRRPAPKKVEA